VSDPRNPEEPEELFRMRLLLITENYPPDRGGMAESCDRIVRGLAREGVAMDLVHFDRRCAASAHRTTSFGSLTRVAAEADAAHTINLLWNRIQQTIDASRITHVVAFGGAMPMLSAPVFAAWMGRPLVTLIRGNELDAGLFDPRRRPILDDALRRSAAVCTVTAEQAEKITALHPQATAHVVANGIDFDLWQATEAEAGRARDWRARNVDPGHRVLGIFGHLKSKKGVPFFLDALRRSSVAGRFHLLLAGEVAESVKEIDIAHTMLPVMDRLDLIPHYLASDLVVLPSHYDGFPNVLIEAAALRRPCIASNVGGMRDLLTEGENAFLFAAGDEHACREAIERAADADDDTLRRMGDSAATVARLRCDARDEARRYVQVFQSAQEDIDANADLHRHAVPAPRRLSWRAG
jgi:glycogen(starch) synthase